MNRYQAWYMVFSSFTLIAHNAEDIHRYLWANFQQFDQQYTQAQSLYEPLMHNNPSPYAYKGYISYLQETGQWQKITGLITVIDSYFAQDLDMQMVAAQALERSGNQNGCDERIIKLNDRFKTNQDVAFAAAQIYQRRKEPENALKVIDRYLNSTGDRANNFIFYFMKSQILVQMEKKPEALVAVKKSLELYPKFDKSWLLMAILEEQAGRIQQAINGYHTFLKETNDSKTLVQEHLTALVIQHKITPISTDDANKNSLMEVRQLLAQKELKKALAAIDACLAQEPNNADYRLIKLDILMQQKEFNPAVDLIKGWIVQQPTSEIWYQTLHLMSNHGLEMAKIITAFEEIEKKCKNCNLPTLYLADLYLRAQSPHALACLKRAAHMTPEKHVKVKILYQIALLQYDKQAMKEVKKTLLSLYELDKEFLPALNMLAYYYASKEKNLPHAFMLIEKVVMKEPTNPHYLDTKAFILYKQGNYAPARALFEQCLKLAPHDAMIERHLAKTLYKMGETATAKNLLSKTVARAGHNEREKKKLITLAQRWNNERKN